ncbi:MAG: energy transducer TonB [Candidatus Neomarinimicrobiota bacterium]|nr:MAG: energy transducer TonB [Candidatus Neomarinimicrobiota bacterium]
MATIRSHEPILKYQYPVVVRIMGLISILLVITAFLVFPRFVKEIVQLEAQQIVIEQIDIPQTQQIDRPPPPARPAIPIESEDEDIAEDLTIEETELENFEAWDAPPPPPSGPKVKFIPYDDPPVALAKITPKYPEIAQEAGIEGTVVVQAFIDEKGRVTETIVLKGIPNTGLDEAAVEAVRATRFKPARQRERPVGVWISIPIHFTITN